MIRTISAVYHAGVFVPLEVIDNLVEETTLEIAVHMPADVDSIWQVNRAYTLEENLKLLQETSGILYSALVEDEVRYMVESPDLAQENVWLNATRLLQNKMCQSSDQPQSASVTDCSTGSLPPVF